MTRRMFEHLALLLFPLVYAGGLVVAAVNFLRPLPRRPRQAKLQLEQDRSYFDAVGAEPVPVQFNGKKVYVLKVGDSLRAFDAKCTHLDCNVNWNKGVRGFHCPCHGGAFDTSGKVTRKPPQEPLREFALADDDGSGAVVLLDRYLENPT
ncbi:MAG: ubiquinol-cytochrome c reductase iron-sulfur subunit [Planctomycetota bacterium]|nr:ubiquinol-cytochrome c reductase iron-sulfur subunit [Planctomycetota bacterium]MEE3230437.1 ubiquinol-cytochrome c reductase iron-sulfur subunit [Planctomycetota bacterium]